MLLLVLVASVHGRFSFMITAGSLCVAFAFSLLSPSFTLQIPLPPLLTQLLVGRPPPIAGKWLLLLWFLFLTSLSPSKVVVEFLLGDGV